MILNTDARILIAEDDFLISEQIGRMIQQIGYQVAGYAPDGIRAVEMAVELMPDLILMDIRMPNLDGLEASRQINEVCQVPIIVLTAHGTKDLVQDAADVGVLSYLIKPPKLDEMERAITVALARFKDLIELKKTRRELQDSLLEKETLLNEVHHRVKNNLTVVSSLLSLQASSMEDVRIKDALLDSRNRVQSISKIHETLYQSENLSTVDVKTYLSNLSRDIARNYSIESKITLTVEAENIFIGAKQSSPVGLVINELITNSYKYAFPGNQEGEIRIKLQKTEDQIELEYRDTGIGIAKDLDWKNPSTLGLKLIRTLVENQLDGSIELDNSNGTKFTIKFNLESNNKS